MPHTIGQSYDIDFVVQTKKRVLSKRSELICIAIKYGRKFRAEWLKGLKDFATLSKDRVVSCHGIYARTDRLKVDGVDVWPAEKFLAALFKGEIL